MKNCILAVMAAAILGLGGWAATAEAHPRVNVRVKPNGKWNQYERNYNRAFKQGYRYGRSIDRTWDRGWYGPRSGWSAPRGGFHGPGFGVYFCARPVPRIPPSSYEPFASSGGGGLFRSSAASSEPVWVRLTSIRVCPRSRRRSRSDFSERGMSPSGPGTGRDALGEVDPRVAAGDAQARQQATASGRASPLPKSSIPISVQASGVLVAPAKTAAKPSAARTSTGSPRAVATTLRRVPRPMKNRVTSPRMAARRA